MNYSVILDDVAAFLEIVQLSASILETNGDISEESETFGTDTIIKDRNCGITRRKDKK